MQAADPRLNKNRVPSTGQVTLAAGATSTTVSNLAVGVQSRIIHQPKNASAWALYYGRPTYTFDSGTLTLSSVATTPVLYTVDVREFELTHPAAAGGEIVEFIVIAGDVG